MSTTLTETPPTTVAPPPLPRGTAAVLALARFEARELLLQVPVFALLVFYVGYKAWLIVHTSDGMENYPALQDVDRVTQGGPMLVALGVIVCVHMAALRSRRHGTADQFGVLPVEPWRRTVAHVLSVVPVALVVTLVVAAEFLRAALRSGAVGHGSFAELAVGPLTVLLAGAAGALLARVVPYPFAAPIVLFALYALLVAVSALLPSDDPHWLRWLSPVVSDTGGGAPFPSDLLGRPAAWHTLYLAGLAVLLTGGAALLSGGRTTAVKTVTAVALAATAVGVAGQSPADPAELTASRETASMTPERVQTCVKHGPSTYCAFPEWTDRTADWAAVTDRVQRLAGGTAASRPLTVRQRVEARYGLGADAALAPLTKPAQVTVGTAWGGNRVPEFAVGVASVLVTGDEATGGDVCDARVVTIMWLALAAQDDPLTALRNVRVDDTTEGAAVALTPTNPLAMSAEQTRIVTDLLAKPREATAESVRTHWRELTSPKTSLTEVSRLLGVRPPAKGVGSGDACEE